MACVSSSPAVAGAPWWSRDDQRKDLEMDSRFPVEAKLTSNPTERDAASIVELQRLFGRKAGKGLLFACAASAFRLPGKSTPCRSDRFDPAVEVVGKWRARSATVIGI